ncbi:MAG: hypothetical protein ACR2KK_14940 [Acidimicrobiales bacterium]
MATLQDAEEAFTDEELTVLALAADPEAGVADDAVPLGQFLGAGAWSGEGELLPGWYMPPPMATTRLLHGWRRRIVLLIVASFVLINAYGLCSTYGSVGFG